MLLTLAKRMAGLGHRLDTENERLSKYRNIVATLYVRKNEGMVCTTIQLCWILELHLFVFFRRGRAVILLPPAPAAIGGPDNVWHSVLNPFWMLAHAL